MKFNKYARHYELDDLHVLFNMLNDVIVVIDKELFDAINPYLKTPADIQRINQELYDNLLDSGFIVTDSADETDDLIRSWQEEDSNPAQIKLTVNPTLQCNLRCWYCYEDHSGQSKVSPATMEAIKRLIDNILSRKSLQKLLLDFFGGEPLLYFDSCMKPLVEYADHAAACSGKAIGYALTTNATLLSDNVCRTLSSLHGPVSLQITLDGDRERHDSIRFFESGKGTFDIIIANIKRALSCGFYVTVRFNYTSKNYDSYQSLLSEFENITEEQKRYLDFSFHRVWQEEETEDVEARILETKSTFSDSGFDVNIPVSLGAGMCYADRSRNLVINHNGLVYKCTARDFSPERAEGRLLDDGSVQWNERYFQRENIKYGSETCRKCSIFPLCHNGCSQSKLEQEPDDGSCPKGYSDSYKEDIAKARATQLLQLKTNKHNINN